MKALLVVSFGTSVAGVAERTIGAVERALAAAFPDRALFSAWTSRFICTKVERETGVRHMQMQEACEALVAVGVDDLLVQPTYLMQNEEYNLMRAGLHDYAAGIAQVRVGETLLASADDCARLACAIGMEFPAEGDGSALVLMGHGSESGGNEVYAVMQHAFEDAGRPDVIVGTVEGTPTFEDVEAAVMERMPALVRLAPFMVVAGDHAVNDLAGSDPDSWKSRLEDKGFACEAVLRGLGEYPAVQELFVEHARQALAEA